MTWDFRRAKYRVLERMRYDTPGDWHDDFIDAWAGLPEPSQEAVQFHELIEFAIIRKAGITQEVIDIIDNYRLASQQYAKDEIGMEAFAEAAILYEAIPKAIRNLYDQAHFIALLAERALIEAGGYTWKDHDDFIEATRGKIPVEKGDICEKCGQVIHFFAAIGVTEGETDYKDGPRKICGCPGKRITDYHDS
jgi:hypothetical protein